eukprot:scaffold44604_cov46-Cyclotella_meneghiniana.AAC.2
MQGAITEEEAIRIRGFALNGEGSSLSSSESEFRRKAWLALAPLCEETTLSKFVMCKEDCNGPAVYEDDINGSTSSAHNTLESSPLKQMEASDEKRLDNTLSKCEDEIVTAEGRATAKRRKVECDALKKWYDKHETNPYPSKEEKAELMMTTMLTKTQISKWFASERRKKKSRGGITAGAVQLSKEALEKLRKWYDNHESHPHPTKAEMAELVLTTNLTEYQINTWFKCALVASSKQRTKERLPTAAVSELKKWYDNHESHPYPTKEEMAELVLTTKLTEYQINTWFKCALVASSKQRTKERRLLTAAVSEPKKWYDKHESHPYPTVEELRHMALTTKVTENQINDWLKSERQAVAVSKLRKWYDEHKAHPYPTKEEMAELALTTKLSEYQINTWFKCALVASSKQRTKEKLPIAAVSELKKWYNKHRLNPYPSKEEKAQMVLTTRLTETQIKDWFNRERMKRRKVKLSREAAEILRKWYVEHEAHPFLRKEDLRQLASTTKLTDEQISNWFIVERARKKELQK